MGPAIRSILRQSSKTMNNTADCHPEEAKPTKDLRICSTPHMQGLFIMLPEAKGLERGSWRVASARGGKITFRKGIRS